ncbi:hypothetical protein Hanom_Chr12g01143551 [Helianthus anomalus]
MGLRLGMSSQRWSMARVLTIVVYNLDDEKRCVGDVYSIDNSLKDILLRKGDELPWRWEAD